MTVSAGFFLGSLQIADITLIHFGPVRVQSKHVPLSLFGPCLHPLRTVPRTFYIHAFSPHVVSFSANQAAAPTCFLQSHSRAYFPKGSACFIYWTSLWPCLRHGSLACSLPLPSAQASACWGRCPQTPIYYT